MQGLNFIAIDFETATGKRASVCEAGICVVKDGKVVETKSWLVRPCAQFEIPEGKHHRAGDDAEMCARLFLKEVRDAGWCELSEMNYCNGRL